MFRLDMRNGFLGFIVLALGLLLCGTTKAATHSFELTTLFEASDVPAPSDPSLATLFFDSSFAGDDVITLAGGSFTEIIGLFRKTPGNTTVETIFDATALAPSTGTPIIGFVFPAGDESDVLTSLAARDNLGAPVTEIARHSGTANGLTTVVSTASTLPGEFRNVDTVGLNRFSVADGSVAYFAALDDGTPNEQLGIYLSPTNGGSTTTLVDTTTTVPGAGDATTFDLFFLSRGAYDGTQTTFRGEYEEAGSTTSGLFQVSAGSAPTPLIVRGDPLPSNEIGSNYGFFLPTQADGDVVFRVNDLSGDGIFAFLDGTLTRIADSATPLPQAPAETFSRFFTNNIVAPTYTIDAGRILFAAQGTDGSRGVYLYDEGDLSLVLKEGDLIDGLPLTLLNIYPHSLRGNQIVMDLVLFDEGAETLEGRVMLATFGSSSADFNGDGSVDVADLSQWQDDYSINADSDADGDNDSDGDDFLAWQQQRQLSALSEDAATTIPEPSSLVLMMGILLAARIGSYR